MQRALIAAASLMVPPVGALAVRSLPLRVLLLAASLAAAAVFFGLWVGPGALLWAATGVLSALAVLLGRR
ncbi:hypothetical protein [Azospirillum halopraeferens]|uniref:hypothetical protein n=1 Tax=Azospirillum halopraeferens TaxID=34010 RepID=UPI00040F470B|nr:hypothetical protein [Azospirillum halopraeferens]